jgi:hypothetical protein
MMDIGILQYGFSGRTQLIWSQGPLRGFIGSYFNTPVTFKQDIKLEKIFNARGLCRIAGINIIWTNNLADHLLITDDEDKKVAIFHHASFLKYQRR